MLYLCRVKPLRHYLRGFLIAAWAGDKIAEFSFPEISFHFPLRPWFFFVSPAYAGKSHSYLNSTFLNLGSPPRMRGKVIHSLCDRPQRGITPAYAGKRRACWWTHRRTRDHPRVCGEKSKTKDTAAYTPGSPPHVRGKVSTRFCAISCHGITPACAGKRCLHRFCKGISKDHPRVCGEKSRCWLDLEPPTGSPPRMRGKVTSGMLFLAFIGITPAYAGKRQMARKAGRTKPDHPRVCGEKPALILRITWLQGSPPRMRGKVCVKLHRQLVRGITPAYAGKSLRKTPPPARQRDHPRVCGEKVSQPHYSTG